MSEVLGLPPVFLGAGQLILLLVVTSERRERYARQALRASADVRLVTTTAARHDSDPLARNWLALAAERRIALAELARDGARTNFKPAAGIAPGRGASPQSGSSAGPKRTAYTTPATQPD